MIANKLLQLLFFFEKWPPPRLIITGPSFLSSPPLIVRIPVTRILVVAVAHQSCDVVALLLIVASFVPHMVDAQHPS